jgi:hypothetical protein
MIGYPTTNLDSWHLAFVKLGKSNAHGRLGLWIFPASSCMYLAQKDVATENIRALSREFQRFTRSKQGVAISLNQHPRNFGPLMLGEGIDMSAFLATSCCHRTTANVSAFSVQRKTCEIAKILQEIGVDNIYLEYPSGSELQKGPECFSCLKQVRDSNPK